MALTAGALSKNTVGQSTANLTSAAATGGTGPYTYQWYMSTVSSFTAGPSNIVTGATALTQAFTGLQPGVTYYFAVIATDTGNGNATVTSATLTVVTAPAQNQNQFTQTAVVGMPDQKMNFNTMSCMIDTTETATTNQPGTAVKMVANSTGIPKVIACAANSDVCMGFISYDIQHVSFQIGDRCEVAQAGDVIYLISVGAIASGVQVQLDLTYAGGVKTKTGSSGAQYVGWAMDATTADGQLLRVKLATPSYTVF